MAKKTVADAAKAKQAKQKKIVILLGVVFALAMVYAFMTISGMQGGGGQKPVAAAVSVNASSSSTTVASSTAPAPTLAGTTPPASTSSSSSSSSSTTTDTTTDSSQLVAVVTPPMDPGQLQSFGRFASKDPFDSSGPGTTKSSGSSGSSGSGGSGGSGGSTPKTPPPPPAAPATQAVISVNGTQESVTAGSNFPSTNPIFLLVSVTLTQAKVAIAGGSYSSGQPTLTLSVNKPVTLVNTADGTRYTLILLPQGTAVAPSSSSSSSSGSSSVTPPVSTTPTSTTPAGP